MKRVAFLLLLVCAGCSAQSDSSKAQPTPASPAPAQTPAAVSGTPVAPDLKAKIQRQIQAQYDLPPDVKIDVGPRRPSDFPTFDIVTITLSGGGNDARQQKVDFLLAQDGKTLAKVTKMDLTKDVYAERMNKIDVKDRPVRGNPNAKVTVVNYDDLQCPFCSRMHATLMTEILPQYGDRIRIVYKDFPLSMHPWAPHSANDANCLAAENGTAYWEFADYVHANQKAISSGQDLQKATAELDRIALDLGKKHGADADRLQACIKSQPDKQLKSSMAEGESLGLNATPTLFINGQKLEGAVDVDEIRAVLNQQLLAAGVQPPAPLAVPAKQATGNK
jgi:protein-disulfide isomerase